MILYVFVTQPDYIDVKKALMMCFTSLELSILSELQVSFLPTASMCRCWLLILLSHEAQAVENHQLRTK